jgi:mannose-1-phosphate guanylyltransferase
MSKVYAVIMAGGAGTRFWPASRALRPKQLLPLSGGAPLLAETVRRLAPVVTEDRVIVVTGEHLAEGTSKAVPGVPRNQILKEPAPRNTAPCIAWANAVVSRLDPEAVVAVLPSDHFIGDEPAFRRVLEQAIESARGGRVTTIGIVPTRPETGYGYVELGEDLGGGVRKVARFVEKPNRETAEKFLAGKRHLWNAGMFFFRVKDMTALVSKHLPDLAAGIAKIDSDPNALASVFPTLPSVSIDVGVMERAEGLALVPGDFGWNDIGSWESAWELATKDAHGNAVEASTVVVDANNNFVRSKKVVALLGVNDLVVVDTEDALLVMPRERAQDVRSVIEELKKRGVKDLL